jgi:SAM-dependent methyltransferase
VRILDDIAAAAVRRYFDGAYRLLTGSPEGRRFLEEAAPIAGVPVHGYTTQADLDRLVMHLDAVGPGPVLDLGCGVGGITVEVSRRTGRQIIGVDQSSHAIGVATEWASGLDPRPDVDFTIGPIGRPPRVRAVAALALDSLNFSRLDTDLLDGIRVSMQQPGRLFTAVLAAGRSGGDPLASLAVAGGLTVIESQDVTVELLRRSRIRRRIARQALRAGSVSVGGRLALGLVVVEETIVAAAARSGYLRRWRTVLDLSPPI